MARHAVVIGAGIAGLATSALLVRSGMQVTVIDKLEELGGRAGSFAHEGFRWDTGPSWYLMPEAFDHFFELCGTSTAAELDLVELAPAYTVCNEQGRVAQVTSGLGHVEKLFESLEPGAGEKVRAYLEQAEKLYQLALRHFLYTNFARTANFLNPAILRNVGLLGRLLLNSLERHVAAQFAHPVLRQVLSYPAVFLSTSPGRAPALYSLMSHTDLVQGVRYPMGGFKAVVEAIARQARNAGVEFLLGQEVRAITVEDGRAVGVETAQRQLRADVVVSCADVEHTKTLLPGTAADSGVVRAADKHPKGSKDSKDPKDPGISAVLLLLGVRGSLPQLTHHTLLFSEDWNPDFQAVFGDGKQKASRSLYISKTSATDPNVAPKGHENLFVLVPTRADETLGHGNAYGTQSPEVAAIADQAIEQIGAWLGIKDFRERITCSFSIGPADFAQRYHSYRAGAIGPAHTLRQSAMLRGRNDSKVAGLYFAGGTTVPGVGVPMCLISAENVVKRLAGDRSDAPLRELPDLEG